MGNTGSHWSGSEEGEHMKKTQLVWLVFLGIMVSGTSCAREEPKDEEVRSWLLRSCEPDASRPPELTPVPGKEFAHCDLQVPGCFPEFSRWMLVTDPDPAVSEGSWHDFPADLGMSPVPTGHARVALLPRAFPSTPAPPTATPASAKAPATTTPAAATRPGSSSKRGSPPSKEGVGGWPSPREWRR